MGETVHKRPRLEVSAASARDRCLLVDIPTQPPWKDAEPLQDSALLGRLQSFLPAMQKANKELEQAAAESPDHCDIESFAEGAPHIEMNLACGLLDLKDSSAAAAAQRAVNVANTSEAISKLPVLREESSIEDQLVEPGTFVTFESAAEGEGSMMVERASRRIGMAKHDHTDRGRTGVEPGIPCSPGSTGDQSAAP